MLINFIDIDDNEIESISLPHNVFKIGDKLDLRVANRDMVAWPNIKEINRRFEVLDVETFIRIVYHANRTTDQYIQTSVTIKAL